MVFRGIQIMVVDDEDDGGAAIRALLPAEGVEVVTCSSGAQALAKLALCAPAIVIARQRLTGMGGIELLEQVRERAPATRRVLLTDGSSSDVTMNAVNQAEIHRILVRSRGEDEMRGVLAELIDELRAGRQP